MNLATQKAILNAFDIHDMDKLKVFERKPTMLLIMELIDNPIKGSFQKNRCLTQVGIIFCKYEQIEAIFSSCITKII